MRGARTCRWLPVKGAAPPSVVLFGAPLLTVGSSPDCCCCAWRPLGAAPPRCARTQSRTPALRPHHTVGKAEGRWAMPKGSGRLCNVRW